MRVSRIIAIILIIAVLFDSSYIGMLLGSRAEIGVEVINVEAFQYTDNNDSADLKITWDYEPSSSSTVKITYHRPWDNISCVKTVYEFSNTTKILEFDDLSNNIIYDFNVEVYRLGKKVAEGFMYYIPKIRFDVESIRQKRVAMLNGGFEIGDIPRLRLSWNIPKIWVPGNDAGAQIGDPDCIVREGEFVDIGSAESFHQMNSNLIKDKNNQNDTLASMKYRIDISHDKREKISGLKQPASVIVSNTDNQYSAKLDSIGVQSSVYGEVYEVQGQDKLTFDILGKAKDTDPSMAEICAEDPTSKGIIMEKIRGRFDDLTEHDVLPHDDILPGNIYFMSIGMDFVNVNGNGVSALTQNDPDDRYIINMNLIYGTKGYCFTPVRFQLFKDNDANINTKIFKVVTGSANAAGLLYSIVSGIEPNYNERTPLGSAVTGDFGTSDVVYIILPEKEIKDNRDYKIIVTASDPAFKITSGNMKYSPGEDEAKLPVPRRVAISANNVSIAVGEVTDENNDISIKKSANVTISWEKPSNWINIKKETDSSKDLIYHIMLNTMQKEDNPDLELPLYSDGTIIGRFPAIFRKVKFISPKDIVENGTSLQYTLKGLELFDGCTSLDGTENLTAGVDYPSGYPKYLLPNTTYYVEMYCTNTDDRNTTDAEKMSDKSNLVSFTTKVGESGISIPVPKNFRLLKNDSLVDVDTSKELNYIEVQFQKGIINWDYFAPELSINDSVYKSVYYDIYMSTKYDNKSFISVSSTEFPGINTIFEGDTSVFSLDIKANISKFVVATEPYISFGETLRPYSTYYIKARTRIRIFGKDDQISGFTNIIPITTKKIGTAAKGEQYEKIIAPKDFEILKDYRGNLLIDDRSVTFGWNRKDKDVNYQIIATSFYVNPSEAETTIKNDNLYKTYESVFGSVYLDPENIPEDSNFELINNTYCKFTINKWILPNTLYFFSIRAIKKDNEKQVSSWVCIPATTMLIKEPESLEAILRPEIRFNWEGPVSGSDITSYKILIKKSSEDASDYKEVQRISRIVSTYANQFYVRVVNLEPTTEYDVKITNFSNNDVLFVYTNLTTLNSMHQVEVRWIGIKDFTYSLSAKYQNQGQYSDIAENDLEDVYNQDDNPILYIERDNILEKEGKRYYYARINRIPTEPGVNSSIALIKGNSKISVKLRTYKIDPLNSLSVSWSKFVGPVFTRTELDQNDLETDSRLKEKKDDFDSEINKLNETLFWDLSFGIETANRVCLKGDRITNILQVSEEDSFTIDITSKDKTVETDVVYIPSSIIKVINHNGKIFVIKSKNSTFAILPGTINPKTSEDIVYVRGQKNVQDIFYRFDITTLKKPSMSVPRNVSSLSVSNKASIRALGITKEENIVTENLIDFTDNIKTGIVPVAKNTINNPNADIVALSNDIKRSIGTYLYNVLTTGNIYSLVVSEREINSYKVPLKITISIDKMDANLKYPFVYYNDAHEWIKISKDFQTGDRKVIFNVLGAGQFFIGTEESTKSSTSNNKNLSLEEKLDRKYSIYDVFAKKNDTILTAEISAKESLLAIDRIMNGNKNLKNSLREIIENLDVEDIKNIDIEEKIFKQDMAILAVVLYTNKTGMDIQKLRPSKEIYCSDQNQIDLQYTKYCIISMELDFLSLNQLGQFNPKKTLSYSEVLMVINNVLKKVGIVV